MMLSTNGIKVDEQCMEKDAEESGRGLPVEWQLSRLEGVTGRQDELCSSRKQVSSFTGWANLLINSESRYSEGLKVTTTLTGVRCNIWVTLLVLLVHIKINTKLNLDVAWTMCFQAVTSWVTTMCRLVGIKFRSNTTPLLWRRPWRVEQTVHPKRW